MKYLTCIGDLNISAIILQVFIPNSNGTTVFGKFVFNFRMGIIPLFLTNTYFTIFDNLIELGIKDEERNELVGT